MTNDELYTKLKHYLRHDETCASRKRPGWIAICPECGSKNIRWRKGVGFENEVICENFHAWVPELVYPPCDCGLDELEKLKEYPK